MKVRVTGNVPGFTEPQMLGTNANGALVLDRKVLERFADPETVKVALGTNGRAVLHTNAAGGATLYPIMVDVRQDQRIVSLALPVIIEQAADIFIGSIELHLEIVEQ